jgi:hypothetical protein
VGEFRSRPYDRPVVANVFENDADGALNPSTVRVAGTPERGTARVNPDGDITHTSGDTYRESDSFLPKVCDGGPAPNAPPLDPPPTDPRAQGSCVGVAAGRSSPAAHNPSGRVLR